MAGARQKIKLRYLEDLSTDKNITDEVLKELTELKHPIKDFEVKFSDDAIKLVNSLLNTSAKIKEDKNLLVDFILENYLQKRKEKHELNRKIVDIFGDDISSSEDESGDSEAQGTTSTRANYPANNGKHYNSTIQMFSSRMSLDKKSSLDLLSFLENKGNGIQDVDIYASEIVNEKIASNLDGSTNKQKDNEIIFDFMMFAHLQRKYDFWRIYNGNEKTTEKSHTSSSSENDNDESTSSTSSSSGEDDDHTHTTTTCDNEDTQSLESSSYNSERRKASSALANRLPRNKKAKILLKTLWQIKEPLVDLVLYGNKQAGKVINRYIERSKNSFHDGTAIAEYLLQIYLYRIRALRPRFHFKCENCSKYFTKRRKLLNHRKKYHKEISRKKTF